MPTRRDVIAAIERLSLWGSPRGSGFFRLWLRGAPLHWPSQTVFRRLRSRYCPRAARASHSRKRRSTCTRRCKISPTISIATSASIPRSRSGAASRMAFHSISSIRALPTPLAVDIYIVSGNEQAKLNYIPDLFKFGPLVQKPTGEHRPSLFRASACAIRSTARMFSTKFAVFQGASYFRAVGKGPALWPVGARPCHRHGQPKGEEFPFFRSFWIKTPIWASRTVVVDALLNSPSATGAFRFNHQARRCDPHGRRDDAVSAPRPRSCRHRALTSMYLFGASQGRLRRFTGWRSMTPTVFSWSTGARCGIWRPTRQSQDAPRSALSWTRIRAASASLAQAPLRGLSRSRGKVRAPGRACGSNRSATGPAAGSSSMKFLRIWKSTTISLHSGATGSVLAQGSANSFIYRLSWCREWPDEGQAPKALARFSGGG